MKNRLNYKSVTGFAVIISLFGDIPLQQQISNHSVEIAQNRPVVVATTSVICDLTEQIAGETVDLKCLVAGGIDPHVYQPTPQDRKAIDSANLILYSGYNFEPTLIKLIKAASNSATKIAVAEMAVPKPIMSEEDEDEHSSGGQKRLAPDPHVWHNAENGAAMVEVISQQLQKLESKNASIYRDKAKQLSGEIKQINSWIKSRIKTIPPKQRKLVTTHDALNYYAQAYGLIIEGALVGLSTDQQPTAARVAELVKEIKASGVPTIFAEISVNPQLINTVAQEANVKVAQEKLYADGLGEKGSSGDTYQKMLTNNTKSIVEGLGGKYIPFQGQ